MVVSLFKKKNNLTELGAGFRKLDYPTDIIVALCQRVIHWRHTIKNHSDPIDIKKLTVLEESPLSESSTRTQPALSSVLTSGTNVSCTSNFDAENKYLAVVTIAMVLEFEPENAAINSRYYSDFKKIANFFSDCSQIMVLFEGCGIGSSTFNYNPIAKLRFNNIAKYLFENFEVSPSHFCPVDSNNFIKREEHRSDLDLQDTYQVKFLFSYKHIAEAHYLVGQN